MGGRSHRPSRASLPRAGLIPGIFGLLLLGGRVNGDVQVRVSQVRFNCEFETEVQDCRYRLDSLAEAKECALAVGSNCIENGLATITFAVHDLPDVCGALRKPSKTRASTTAAVPGLYAAIDLSPVKRAIEEADIGRTVSTRILSVNSGYSIDVDSCDTSRIEAHFLESCDEALSADPRLAKMTCAEAPRIYGFIPEPANDLENQLVLRDLFGTTNVCTTFGVKLENERFFPTGPLLFVLPYPPPTGQTCQGTRFLTNPPTALAEIVLDVGTNLGPGDEPEPTPAPASARSLAVNSQAAMIAYLLVTVIGASSS